MMYSEINVHISKSNFLNYFFISLPYFIFSIIAWNLILRDKAIYWDKEVYRDLIESKAYWSWFAEYKDRFL